MLKRGQRIGNWIFKKRDTARAYRARARVHPEILRRRADIIIRRPTDDGHRYIAEETWDGAPTPDEDRHSERETISYNFESKYKFWILKINANSPRGSFTKTVWPTPRLEKIAGKHIDQLELPIDWNFQFDEEDPRSLIHATKWADEEIFKLDSLILTGPRHFSDRVYEKLKSKDPGETVKYLEYLSFFLKRLQDKIIHGSSEEKREAIGLAASLIDGRPLYVKVIQGSDGLDELKVIVDHLLAKGKVIVNPSNIKKSKPRYIVHCQNLWEKYRKSPTKKNLKAVFDHLEVMKSSKSEKVKQERARCLRAANKEAKRLKM